MLNAWRVFTHISLIFIIKHHGNLLGPCNHNLCVTLQLYVVGSASENIKSAKGKMGISEL